MQRNEENGGNYFWIKSPVDLFLFSASPPNLQLLYSASISSFLSISIVLKAFSILHLLTARRFFFDFPRYSIPPCPHLFPAQPHLPSRFLSLLLSLILSEYFICSKTLIKKTLPNVRTDNTGDKRTNPHTQTHTLYMN